MRIYIFLAMFLLAGITKSQAQRMLPGQKGLEVNAGILTNDRIGRDYYINMGLTVNGRSGNYMLWALEYTHKYHAYKDISIPHETFTAEGGYSLALLGNSRKSITLNFGLSAVGGYERINRERPWLYDGALIVSKDRFIYGAGGRLSLETYLTNKLVLLLQGRTKMLWGTDLKQLRPSAGVGLRFNF